MEKERITISIKKQLLKSIDKTIDGTKIRNRSHAIEELLTQTLNSTDNKDAVILLGGKDALKSIPAVISILDDLASNGFQEVYIAVGFLADKIKDKLGDGETFGLKFHYVTEGEGSGGALLTLKNTLKKPFLVINIDREVTFDFKKLLEYHKNNNATATVATENIKELKGFYICDPKIFSYIPKSFSMIETDILPKLASDGKLIITPIFN